MYTRSGQSIIEQLTLFFSAGAEYLESAYRKKSAQDGRDWRKRFPAVPEAEEREETYIMKYQDTNLKAEILQGIAEMGFEEMTPIQEQAIPAILDGKDIVGLAQTGTGKTAAFGIPLLSLVEPAERSVQAVVLCPTRELAMQDAEEIATMGKYVDGLKILSVYGGSDIVRQLKALRKGVTAVIGTPGRVMDHMRRGTLKLENVKYLVLDEADEMLDMGFRDDIETICQAMPEERQTALFSATMPDEILELTRAYQKDPEIIEVSHDELTVPKIKQSYYMVKGRQKDEALCRLIDYMCPKRALVFCNTKRKVDQLTLLLKRRGYSAEGLHGDLSQQQRDRVMDLFRSGNLDLLLATDVAARGIDVDDVDIVFNYDLPQEMEYYVHRIGRTGRAGKKGKAVSLINTRERRKINALQEFTGASIKEKVMPSYRDVMPIKANSNIERALKFCEGMDLTEYADMIRSYAMENHTDQLLIAAAFLRESLGEAREDIEIVSGKRGGGKKGSRRNSGRNGNSGHSGRSGKSGQYGKSRRRSGRSDSDFSRNKNKHSRKRRDAESRDFGRERRSSSRNFGKDSGRREGGRDEKSGSRGHSGRDFSGRKRSGKFVKPGSHSGKGARRGESGEGFRAFRGKRK